MNVSALLYAPCAGGRLGGAFCLELLLSSEEQLELSAVEVASRLREAALRFAPAYPTRLPVFIDARGLSFEDLNDVVVTLRSNGVPVYAHTDGSTIPSWMRSTSGLIVTVWNTPWLGFEPFEFRYQPSLEDDSWNEPSPLPNAPKYLVVPKGAPKSRVYDFIKNAKAQWGIILPRPSALETVIL